MIFFLRVLVLCWHFLVACWSFLFSTLYLVYWISPPMKLLIPCFVYHLNCLYPWDDNLSGDLNARWLPVSNGLHVSCSITKNSMYQLMQPQIDIILFEIIFPLMCFNDNDQMLWDEDPHEYIRKGYGKIASLNSSQLHFQFSSLYSWCFFLLHTDIIEDLYSPRTAAMDFVSELVRKRGKGNLQKFIQFIVGIFMRYLSFLCDLCCESQPLWAI